MGTGLGLTVSGGRPTKLGMPGFFCHGLAGVSISSSGIGWASGKVSWKENGPPAVKARGCAACPATRNPAADGIAGAPEVLTIKPSYTYVHAGLLLKSKN